MALGAAHRAIACRKAFIQPGPAVTIADGTQASRGDLIICTRNDHTVEAGEPGRMLANGDLLRIEAVTPDGLRVRRALDPGIRLPGSAAGPTDTFCSIATTMPSSVTRSPTTWAWVAP